MIEDYFDQTAILISQSTSTGWNEGGWSTGGTTIECAINFITGDERFAADKQTVFADYKMFCRATESINEAQRILWNNKTLDILKVKNTFQMDHHKLVLLKDKSDV